MKRSLTFVIIIQLLMPGFVSAQKKTESDRLFAEGLELFRQKQFTRAAGVFSVAEKAGHHQPAIYLNMGTAYYKGGEVGKAIYAYKQGLKRHPFNHQLRHNTDFAVHAASLPADSSILLTLSFMADRIVLFTCIVMMLVLAIYVCFLLKRKRQLSAKNRTAFKLLLWLFAGVLLIAVAVIYIAEARRTGIILNKNIKAVAGPSADAVKVFVPTEGEQILIKREFNGWLKIERSNGVIGWFPAGQVGEL